jgi:hypothetical protein
MYFQPGTQYPISLLELGLACAGRNRVFVCCPDGFYRKGNIDIMCETYNVPITDSFDELVGMIDFYITNYNR